MAAVSTGKAPKPVGAYPHARVFGNLLFVSGMGPRSPKDNTIPGGPVWDENGNERNYDVAAQTRATIANIRTVLEESGAKFEDIIDVQCFLINMKRDFKAFNQAYKEEFSTIPQPTRTTVSVRALPTPIAVELKVIARAPGSSIRPEELRTSSAPVPVGAYPHSRRYGDLLFVSGMGPRNPKTNEVPGGPIYDTNGKPQEYDVRAQTHATIENIRAVLEAGGSSLADVIDVTCFLINMKRDFAGFNEVYKQHFGAIEPTRTTMAIRNLPTPIAVELKVIARAPGSSLRIPRGIFAKTAPRPIGAFPHAKQFGDLLFISGMGPVHPKTGSIIGGAVKESGEQTYDAGEQTRATIANIKDVLTAAGGRLEDILDVQCFLINMKRDFQAFNKAYREELGHVAPTRTTMSVRALPVPIAVELKVIARAPRPPAKL